MDLTIKGSPIDDYRRKPMKGDFTDPTFWTHRNRNKTKKPPRPLAARPLAEVFNVDRTGYYVYRSPAGKVFIRVKPMDITKQTPAVKFMGRSSVGSAKQVLREAKERFGNGKDR